MKSKIYTTIAVLSLIVSSALFLSCQDDESAISFSNDALATLEKIDLSSVASFDYSNEESNKMTDDKADSLKGKLMSYTNADLKPGENTSNSLVFKSSEDSSAILDIDTGIGGFVFNKGMNNYSEETDTLGLPDENDAVNAAEEHLQNLDLNTKTLSGYSEKNVARIGGLRMATLDKYGVTTEYQKLVTVTYERKLAGLPVMGASRIVVNMGTEGELTGLVWNWPSINQKNQLAGGDVVENSELKNLITNTLKKLYTNTYANTIAVTKIKLVMYDDGAGVVEPALFILGQITPEDKSKTRDADWLIPVLKAHKASYPIFEQPPVMPSVAAE